jgi:hypothetical protein
VPDDEAVAAAFDDARTDALVAGAAALVTVALALLGRPPLRALAPLAAFFGYRLGGRRVLDRPLAWAGLAVVVGVAAAL